MLSQLKMMMAEMPSHNGGLSPRGAGAVTQPVPLFPVLTVAIGIQGLHADPTHPGKK